jgi:TPR repeat protein
MGRQTRATLCAGRTGDAEASNVDSMNQDKRSIVRRRTQQLVYLELGRDNGGVMLNLTESGSGFQAITPVKCGETRFAFQISGGRRIAGEAEIVWVDEVGILGGLRFLNLPLEARKQIRLWLQETNAPEEPGSEPAAEAPLDAGARNSRAPAGREASSERERSRDHSAPASHTSVRTTEEDLSSSPAWANLRAATSAAMHDERFSVPLMHEDGSFGVSRPRSVAVWRSIAVLTTAAAICALLIAYQRDVGASLIWLGQTLSGKTKASGVSPETKPAQPSPAPELNPPSSLPESNATPQKPEEADAAQKKITNTAVPAETQAANRGQTQPANLDSAGNGAARQESVLERQPVREKPPEIWDAGETVESLWGAVQGGSVSAERSLAERFVRGEGVTRNCEQAKVLLRAAANRGSREARLRLYELETQGCR